MIPLNVVDETNLGSAFDSSLDIIENGDAMKLD